MWIPSRLILCVVATLLGAAAAPVHAENLSPSSGEQTPARKTQVRDVTILDGGGVKGCLKGEGARFSAQPTPSLRVDSKQILIELRPEEPVFVTSTTKLSWAWKKEEGKVCILQIVLRNPDTGQVRYFGYGAGAWSEPASADPTVELFLATEPPREWSKVQCPLSSDIKMILGWGSAQVTGVYLSPWDGHPASFADIVFQDASANLGDAAETPLACHPSGRQYTPQRLRHADEKHVDRFETNFEECAPGRNSAANEWSAFGIDGDRDFNAMGRDLHVRYPLFDLVFRLSGHDKEINPGALDSFRLGLLHNRLPAIWGAWMYDEIEYRVTVMTVPGGDLGNYDLYKIQVSNPANQPRGSRLSAVVEGPPDVSLEDNVVRGLGETPLMLVDSPTESQTAFRDWGLCDKRAKAYDLGGDAETERAMATCRIGLDGVPVVYRFKTEPSKTYSVYLASTSHIQGYLLEVPKEPGDLVFEYHVEGCEAKTLDYVETLREKPGPLCIGFEGARDTNGDGYIEVASGVAESSRIRHTRLSVIYVLPQGAQADAHALCRGDLNSRCVWHIDVGSTPEQAANNQEYDKSDIGFARLKLGYTWTLQPGETKLSWIKVPSIHRREPVSMGYIAHAFREVLPGEAIPPFGPGKEIALKAANPVEAEESVIRHWDTFFAKAAEISTPDPVLQDIFLSRLATRAILDVKIDDDVYYNPCSPFFYFDHAYRDQAYVVYAYDLAGFHDSAERLLSAYCKNVDDIKRKGPISFDGQPLQLGMLENGLWKTRPGQFDTQGQNIWALVQHYKLTGDRTWLEQTAYPFVRRGAKWIVDSRHKHMDEVGNPCDPRYGLIEPGAMEVMDVGSGAHMYYLNAFAVLGLREAADAASGLGLEDDVALFSRECKELRESLHYSFEQTFKRLNLYEGHLWFGVEPEGVGMYGFWAHNCLLWPCRCLEPHDPMLTATFRRMERMSNEWGGGLHSEGPGGYWPYIGADRAIGHILRDEPDKALDYFCAFTDTAGGTFSWGEGYNNLMAAGDQPHFWADAQWINLFRHLLVMEDENALMITPATFRRWAKGAVPTEVRNLPTEFGDLDLTITPDPETSSIHFRLNLTPRGDQKRRELSKILLYPRIGDGMSIGSVEYNGIPIQSYTKDVVILSDLKPSSDCRVRISVANNQGH